MLWYLLQCACHGILCPCQNSNSINSPAILNQLLVKIISNESYLLNNRKCVNYENYDKSIIIIIFVIIEYYHKCYFWYLWLLLLWVIPQYFVCHGGDNFEDNISDSSLIKEVWLILTFQWIKQLVTLFYYIVSKLFLQCVGWFSPLFRLLQRGPEKSQKVKVEN